MQTILELLRVQLIKELHGKTKKVYLVSKEQTKYVLKTAQSKEEKALLTKELSVFHELDNAKNLMPDIVDSGNLDKIQFLLQEYYDFGNINTIADRSQLSAAYDKLAEAILKMQTVTRSTCGGFNIEKRFNNWKDYLSYKVDMYKNSILVKHNIDLSEKIFAQLQHNIMEIEEPPCFQFLHMDLHGENIFLNNKGTIRFIDFDEAIFGDKDYELARILKAHFTGSRTTNLITNFLKKLNAEKYIASKKALVYSDLRILYYVEILARENKVQEMHNQIATLSFNLQ